IVDENDLVAQVQRVERGIQAREERREPFFFVVDRNDDRQVRRMHKMILAYRCIFFAERRISETASQTRSTSVSCIEGNRGKVTVSRPIRSAFGKSPSLYPSFR